MMVMHGLHHMGSGFMRCGGRGLMGFGGRRFMGFGGGGIIMMILWMVIIVGLITFLVKKFSNNSSQHNYSKDYRPKQLEDSLEIARRRYAKGEIDKDKLEEIKNELA
ncbi:MAG: hypothetical protein R6V17_01750 [Halanaerobacter sp.]